MNQIILGYTVAADNTKITVAYNSGGLISAHVNFHCESAPQTLHSWPWTEATVPVWDAPTSWQIVIRNG